MLETVALRTLLLSSLTFLEVLEETGCPSGNVSVTKAQHNSQKQCFVCLGEKKYC